MKQYQKKNPIGKSSGCSTVHPRLQMANTFGAFPLAPTQLHSVCYFSTDSSRVPSEPNQTKIVTVDRVDGSCDSFTKSNPAFKEKNKSERAFSSWVQQTIEMAGEPVLRLNDEVKTFLRLWRTKKSNGLSGIPGDGRSCLSCLALMTPPTEVVLNCSGKPLNPGWRE